jgi:hypothetical protein
MDPHTRRVALGRLEIAFSGQDFISAAALDEVAHQSRDCTACTGRLSCHFGAPAEPGNGAVQIDGLVVGGEIVLVRDRLLPHSLRWDGSSLEVTVESAPGYWKSPLVAPAVRLVDQSFNDAAQRLGKRFYYTVFDQAVQIAQVPLGQSWVHSSAVTNGDRTVLFMAWGGVGKTATALRLLATGSWRYLSDDLCALDVAGTVYRSPHRVQVFATNLVGMDALRTGLLGGRSPWDVAHWVVRRRVLGEPSVRRRVHAEDLFGTDAVAVSGRVTDAVYLRRTTASDIELEVSTPRDLARLGASVLQVELGPLDRRLATVHSAGPSLNWPTTDEMTRDTASVIERGLTEAAARCFLIGVPTRCGPDDLLRFLQTRVLT